MRIHDSITGTDGSYDRAVKNISLYCKNKSKLSSDTKLHDNKGKPGLFRRTSRIAKRLGADAVKFEHLIS